MKKNKKILLSLFGTIAMLPISALAHTGISVTTGFGSGIEHPFAGADHVLAMLAVGLWAAQIGGGRAVWVLPAAFISLMLFGAGLAIFDIGLPFVEQAILLSVLIFGISIAAACKLPLIISTTVVGLFAVFHGHAHGTEIPLLSGALSYSLGFVLGTACFHAIGILAGIVMRKLNFEKTVRWAGGVIACYGFYLVMA